MFLCHNLALHFQLSYTKAAEMAAVFVKITDRTVRQWRSDFISNDGIMPSTKQGKYLHTGILWKNEELNKKASNYVRANQNVKSKPNMIATVVCKWVNNDFLPNSTLEPGYPRNISLETARRWLHQLGFEFITPWQGIFVDEMVWLSINKQFYAECIKLVFFTTQMHPQMNKKNPYQVI